MNPNNSGTGDSRDAVHAKHSCFAGSSGTLSRNQPSMNKNAGAIPDLRPQGIPKMVNKNQQTTAPTGVMASPQMSMFRNSFFLS